MKALRILTVMSLIVVAACGGPPKTRLERLYEGLTDPLPRIDPSILAGRRVLVDPGHGGYFRGTMGRDSLLETHVNLGVSLYLWGLLREAGAEVYLTRSMDRDFLSDADSSLASDLQARVDMADSLAPDIFVSIHHNAQPARDPSYNRVETYYKAGDPGSLDLAFSIHRHLMRNLGISAGEVRQGNYYVLRNVDIPAVLGESSYLTHPPVEAQLRLSDVQRLEAEAYFLGINDYFARGIPRITGDLPADSIVTRVPKIAFLVEDDGGIGIDPDAIDLRLNGERLDASFNAETGIVSAQPSSDLPNGRFTATLSVRNLLGNTSPTRRVEFTVAHPTHAVVFSHPVSLPASGATTLAVRARLLDRRGLPVADGTDVRVTIKDKEYDLKTKTGVIDLPMTIGANDKELVINVMAGGKTFRSRVVRSDHGTKGITRVRVLRDGLNDAPVLNASPGIASITGPGVYYYDERDEEATVMAPGYVPVKLDASSPDTVRLEPWFGGTLHGRRFVLDPEGGRATDIGMGPLGLSAAHVNLRVAQYLHGFLHAAGADVWLTRTSEEVRTPEDIARKTNEYGADRYIEIRHRNEPAESVLTVRTYHFPGSRNGIRLAADLARRMSQRLGLPLRAASAQVTFPLQQTACPAIIIEAPAISNVDEELRLDHAYYLREQAYSVFVGLLDHFANPDTSTMALRIVDDFPENWLLTVERTWTLLTGPDGVVRFAGLRPGKQYTVTATKGAYTATQRVVAGGAQARIVIERYDRPAGTD